MRSTADLNTPESSSERRILHLDMDAFYAAVEERDRPELRGKPVIVGGAPGSRGVVSTANYEARKFGVHSAMPSGEAYRRCPDAVFLEPDMERYARASKRIFEIFARYTPQIQPLSIDEAFLDVTGCPAPKDSTGDFAVAIAEALRRDVRAETELTASVGVAPNMFLAKLASDLDKPDGLVIVPAEVEAFLAPLPVRKLWGVGPKTEKKLLELGLKSVGDVQRLTEKDMKLLLGEEQGTHLFRLARGLDLRRVTSDHEAKSISQERTFAEFIPKGEVTRIEDLLFSMSEQVAYRLRRAGFYGKTVTLKIRDGNFKTFTRSRSLDQPTCVVEEIFDVVRDLFRHQVKLPGDSVRLLGVGASGLTSEGARQLDIFGREEKKKSQDIAELTDRITEKLGKNAITRGRTLGSKGKPKGGARG